jgi:hypothetical protein
MDNDMASTMKMITSNSSSSSNNFVTGKTLYTETTTTVTTRQTKVNSNDYSTPNIKSMLERQNSSLYTGSIFAAFNCGDMQVKFLLQFVSIFSMSMQLY